MATHPVKRRAGDILTLAGLRDRYLETHRNGSLEQSTLDGIETHFRHLIGTLGKSFPMQDLTMADLQRHVDPRRKNKGLKGKLSPATIRKEIVTLRTAWNWGVQMGLLTGRFPNKGHHLSEVHGEATVPDVGGDRTQDQGGGTDQEGDSANSGIPCT